MNARRSNYNPTDREQSTHFSVEEKEVNPRLSAAFSVAWPAAGPEQRLEPRPEQREEPRPEAGPEPEVIIEIPIGACFKVKDKGYWYEAKVLKKRQKDLVISFQ